MIENENDVLINSKRDKDDERLFKGDDPASPNKCVPKKLKTESTIQTILTFGRPGGVLLPTDKLLKTKVESNENDPEDSIGHNQEALSKVLDVVRSAPEGASKDLESDHFSPDLMAEEDWGWYTVVGQEKKFSGDKSLFALLALVWEKLENLKNTGAGSRQKAIMIMTNYFRTLLHHCPQDLVIAAFLTLHRVAPDYCGIEIGLGESLLIKTMCETYGRKESQVKQTLQQIGDLGSIAMQSRVRMTTLSLPTRLALRTVFYDLTAIAELKGANAQTRKREKVKKLLVSAVDYEPKFLIRFLEKQLRIGVKLQTVLVALAWAFTFSPVENRINDDQLNNEKIRRRILDEGVTADFLTKFSQIKCIPDIRNRAKIKTNTLAEQIIKMETAVKQAYSNVPNMGFLIFWLLLGANDNDLKEQCVICPGVPVAPMLAKPTKGLAEVMDALEGLTFRAEYKYDGERIQIHKLQGGDVRLFSRNMEVLDIKYPDVKEIALNAANPDATDFILDAEVVAIDLANGEILPFQILSGRKRKDVDVKTLAVKVAVFVFDCLRYNGSVLLGTSLLYRQTCLKAAVHEIPNELFYAKGGNISDFSALESLLSEAVDAKTEGLMVKVLEGERSYYEPSKRSMNWLKLKKDYLDTLGDSVDLVPIGAFWGRGKRSGQFGAYLLAVYDPPDETYRTVCKVATGFTDEDLTTHHTFFSDKLLSVKPFYYHSTSGVEPDVWLSASQVWECKAADLSVSPVHTAAFGRKVLGKGLALRFPRYLRIREDKKSENATDSDQIMSMYEKQFASKKALDEVFENESEDDDEKGLKYLDLTTGSELSRVEEAVNTCEKGVFSVGQNGHIRSPLIGCIDPKKPLLRLYRLDKLKAAFKRFTLPETATCGNVSSDGILLAVGSQSGRVHIWDLSSAKYLRCFMIFPEKISQISFCGPYLLVARGCTICVFNISDLIGFSSVDSISTATATNSTPLPLLTFCGHVQPVTSFEGFCSIGCDGYVISADHAGFIYIWCIRTGNILGIVDLDCRKSGILLDEVISTRFYVALQRGEGTILLVECSIPKIAKYYERNRTPIFLESPDNDKEGILKTVVILKRSAPKEGTGDEATGTNFPFLLSLNGKHSHLILSCGDELLAINLENAEVAYKLSFNPLDPITSVLTFCEYPGIKELTQKIHPVRYLGNHNQITNNFSSLGTLNHRPVSSSAENLINVPLGTVSDWKWRHSWIDRSDLGTSAIHQTVNRLWSVFLDCQNEQHVIQQDQEKVHSLQSSIRTTSNMLDNLIKRRYERPDESDSMVDSVTLSEHGSSYEQAEGGITDTLSSDSQQGEKISGDLLTLVHCASAVSRGGAENECVLPPLPNIVSVLNTQPSCYTRPPMNWVFSANTNSNIQLNG